jgi:RIO kinase 1
MRIPESLASLFDYGILEDVVRPLMSGKEAQVYVVVSGGKYRVAKVYKEAQNRTFKHRAEYTEGRKVRNTRDQRAIEKRSKHGRAQDEAAWRSTEVDMIRRLHAAGVRVPVPEHFIDGVLIMELIIDAEGNPAPRLADLVFEPAHAQAMYDRLLREVLRMLCAGVVHGDLSDFNVLVGADGPVIIDFPQSVDTAHNANARKLLLRDVDNLHRFLCQFVPNARRLPYAEEMWDLFQQNTLTPDTRLTGRYRPSERRANTQSVLELIHDANYDERKRRDSLGLRGGPTAAAPPPAAPRHAGGRPTAGQEAPRHDSRPRPPAGPHQGRQQQHRPPPRNGPSRGGSGPQPSQSQPRGPRHDGRPPQTSGGAPSNGAGTGSRSGAPHAPRDRGRPVEVIVVNRRQTPR